MGPPPTCSPALGVGDGCPFLPRTGVVGGPPVFFRGEKREDFFLIEELKYILFKFISLFSFVPSLLFSWGPPI